MLKLELPPQMVQAIMQIVEQAPYRVAAPILNEFNKQIAAQQVIPNGGHIAAGDNRPGNGQSGNIGQPASLRRSGTKEAAKPV